jgi:phytoene synthase
MTQALLEELPPAQRLALAYAPRAARPATLALVALDAPTIDAFVRGRAAALGQLASELGLASAGAEVGGSWWALGDLAGNLADPAERAAVLARAATLPPCPPLPRALRPLAVLAALGKRSLARGGTPLLDGFGAGLLAMRVGIAGR